MVSQMKTLDIFYFLTAEHHGRYGVLIHDSYPDVRLFLSLLRDEFSSRWFQLLQCPLVSPLGVPDQVEESLLQNYCRSWTSQSTRTLAVVTDMHHHTELSLVDEFRWVSPLRYLKNGWQNAVLLWCMLQAGRHFYTTTAPSCCIPALCCHLSATLQTISITVVNLQDNRAVFRIFIALLKFFIWLSLVYI